MGLWPVLFLLAQEGPPVAVDDLVGLAVKNHPSIQAARHRFEAAAKRPSQVRGLPEPKFSVANVGVGHPFSRLGTSDFAWLGFGLSQEVPFPGKLSLAAEQMQREAEAERHMYQVMVREITAQVKAAYCDWFAAWKAIGIARKNRDLLERFEKIARARYAVGRGIQQDVLKAQVELTELAQRVEMLEQKKAVIEAQIRALVYAEVTLTRPAELRLSALTVPLERLLAAIDSPRLRASGAMVASRATGIERAKRDYRPDFNFTFQWQKTGSAFPDYYVAVAEAKIPLYFWRKQRLGVEEAGSRFREARETHRATRQELVFQVTDLYLQLRTGERLLALTQEGLIPQSSLALESALAGYEVGNVDFLTLLDNFSKLLTYESQYWDELARHEQALARLEALVDLDQAKP